MDIKLWINEEEADALEYLLMRLTSELRKTQKEGAGWKYVEPMLAVNEDQERRLASALEKLRRADYEAATKLVISD